MERGHSFRLVAQLQWHRAVQFARVLFGSSILSMAISVSAYAQGKAADGGGLYQVQTVSIERTHCQNSFIAYGQVYPHQTSLLNPRVSGLVEALGEAFEAGRRVTRGQILVSLEKTDFEFRLAEALRQLADAQLMLAEQQALSERAIAEWKVGNQGSPPSLAARKPQITLARAQVDAAEYAVAVARRDLAATDVKAPFDGWVVSRSASVGNMVSPQSSLAELIPAKKVIVRMMLSPEQVEKIKQFGGPEHAEIELFNDIANTSPYFRFSGLDLNAMADAETRQLAASAVLDLEPENEGKVYPGAFFKARIYTQQQGDYFPVPREAFNEAGNIFIVEENKVREMQVATVFNSLGNRVVDIPGEKSVRLVVSKLDRIWHGMPVAEKVASHE